MKLLLDTHIWVWSTLEPQKLSRRMKAYLEDPDNDSWLSPISVWEVLTLVSKQRLRLEPDAFVWIRTSIASASLTDAPLTHEVALASMEMRFTHKDPADRFIAATAKVYGLTLVTADTRLGATPGIKVLLNR